MGRRPSQRSGSLNRLLQQVSVTLELILRTVTHDSDVALAGHLLQQTQRELLAVVLDRAAAGIDGSVHQQLAPVFSDKLSPRYARPVRTERKVLSVGPSEGIHTS